MSLPSSLSFSLKKKLTLYVGGTRLNRKQTTVTSACPTHKQMNGKHQNQFRFFLPTGSPLKKGETTPSSRGQLSSKKVRPSLDLLKEKNRRTQTSQLLKLLTLRSSFETSACRSHSLFFFVFQPVHGKRKACLWQQASCISWHNESRAMWQLKATLARSQSARKRDTYSPDPFCPVTLIARLSSLCSRTSDEERPSLSDHHSPSLSQSRLFKQPCLHMSPKSGD